MSVNKMIIDIASIKKYKNIGLRNIVILLKKKVIKDKYLNVLG